MLHWTVMLYPDREPYNKGAFRVSIDFPAEYPFKPPRVTFMTKIYHPNVDEKGQVCLALITTENWKPATRTEQGEQIKNSCPVQWLRRIKFSDAFPDVVDQRA